MSTLVRSGAATAGICARPSVDRASNPSVDHLPSHRPTFDGDGQL